MPTSNSLLGALFLGCTALSLTACGASGAGSGGGVASGAAVEGTYASIGNDNLSFAFKSGGVVEMAAPGGGSSTGTYTADGDKIAVTIDNRTHTFIKSGECVEDQLGMFGKLCKGGKSGDPGAGTGSPTIGAAQGTWKATNSDGQFTLTFTTLDRLKLEMIPVGGTASTQDGTFVVEGTKLFATFSGGTSMVLIYVNDSFEGSPFGLPLKFVKQ